jgi:7-cyano-7-deazaguanine reductase
MSDTAGQIEVFPNPHPGRHYRIEHFVEHFTSLCPVTGQPDFATIRLVMIPGQTCIELKSLKLYLQGFREMGIFYEDVTNRILLDIVEVSQPVFARVISTWATRGGISSEVTAEHGADPFGQGSP